MNDETRNTSFPANQYTNNRLPHASQMSASSNATKSRSCPPDPQAARSRRSQHLRWKQTSLAGFPRKRCELEQSKEEGIQTWTLAGDELRAFIEVMQKRDYLCVKCSNCQEIDHAKPRCKDTIVEGEWRRWQWWRRC